MEAFANIYRNFALTIRARHAGEEPTAAMLDFPGVEDGVRGMQFVETMVQAGYDPEKKWHKWVEKQRLRPQCSNLLYGRWCYRTIGLFFETELFLIKKCYFF